MATAFASNIRTMAGGAPLRYRAKMSLRIFGQDLFPGQVLTNEQIEQLGKQRITELLSTKKLALVPLEEILAEHRTAKSAVNNPVPVSPPLKVPQPPQKPVAPPKKVPPPTKASKRK